MKKTINLLTQTKKNFNKPSSSNVALLDTSLNSENSGDQIIMEACNKIFKEIFVNSKIIRIPTHTYNTNSESLHSFLKILCGTNIIYSRMENQKQWYLPNDLSSYYNTVLLGVGLSDVDINKKTSLYTKLFFNKILSKDYYHSVRDKRTLKRLNDMGIKNVLNTTCPTMWTLNNKILNKIPKSKSRTVVTSITDYCFDKQQDKLMLSILDQEYEEVIIWVQGSHDVDWCLSKIIDLNKYKVIGPNLEDLERTINKTSFDYIGTRLHAGIKCLNSLKRTIVIAVDERAKAISEDTNLPTINRNEIGHKLSNMINSSFKTDIVLPNKEINKWKQQFKRNLID